MENIKSKNTDARMFEIETSNLFTKKLNFSGQRLEESNKPDVIIFYKKYGAIIDNKSYKKGFLLDKKCSDELKFIEKYS